MFWTIFSYNISITYIRISNGCFCKYDVRFKMSKLPFGNYKLKVYYANPNMKYDESNIAYNGQVNIVQNRKVSVKFKPEIGLPEN